MIVGSSLRCGVGLSGVILHGELTACQSNRLALLAITVTF